LHTFSEYLVSYGSTGGFGCFAGDSELACDRGERVVIETLRGMEVGVVLCEATDQHARLLPAHSGGRLLRRATDQDEMALGHMRQQAQVLFQRCRDLAADLGLPLEVLDVEVLFDGSQVIIQHLAPPDCNAAALVEALAREHGLTVRLENLALTPAVVKEESGGGCGKPDCGRVEGGGGCTSCGSSGCSSCGGGKVDMRQYFAHLRGKMEQHLERTPLL
jgi:cell fate regulator YaaT (PSP1 superfamily)